MKLFLKIIKWTATGVAVIIVILFCISLYLQDNIVSLFINLINDNILTKIEVGSGSFSLLSKFPKATVRFENVLIHSSGNFDRTQFKSANSDTLLSAKSVLLEFKVVDLIKGIYNIESLGIEKGSIYILSDSSGRVNYEIYKQGAQSPGKDFAVTLDKITVSNLNTTFLNKATGINIAGVIKNGRFKSRITGKSIELSASSVMQLSHVEVFPLSLNTTTSASLDINLHKSDTGFLFRKGILKLENSNFGIAGRISAKSIDLKVSGRNIDVSRLKKYLPVKYQDKFTEYDPAGILRIDCRLKGLTDRKNNPEILIYFALDKGSVFNKKSNLKLSNLSFYANFRNGRLRNPESSYLEISKVVGNLGSSEFSGFFTIENFLSPKIDLMLTGDIIISEIADLLNIKDVSWSEGSVRMNLKLLGHLPLQKNYSTTDLLKLNPEADLKFNSTGIGLKNNKIIIKDINGNIKLSRHLQATGLTFTYNDQHVRIDGSFNNLTAWLAGQSVYIKGIADISIDNLKPSVFLNDSSSASVRQRAFKLPDGFDLDINFDINKLDYKKISAEKIKGKLIYKPGLISLKSVSLSSLDGYISGNCFFGKSNRKSFVAQANFDFNQIDINKAFSSSNNFHQDFIKAENLSGLLTGNVTCLLPLDSALNPDFSTATAEGKFIISEGALISFEPVRSLSRFIDLSELEKITFSRLENDFFIRNNYIAFPQMEIKSSAADFTVSGKHDFDNNYEYHVKTYLSQILSKKVKKTRSRPSEFGAVEEDGLGRTSIYLKINGKGDVFKVGYDMKAARGNINKNLKTEKDNLKSILNKEYGWYKKDTTIKQEPAPRPKFRIQWEESDSTATRADTITLKKDRGINTIFKRKRAEINFDKK